jgi:hypothetical protein
MTWDGWIKKVAALTREDVHVTSWLSVRCDVKVRPAQ